MMSETKEASTKTYDDIESGVNVTFIPPVYIQRYRAIQSVLEEEKWLKEITKVVEFGCAELKLFKYLKPLQHIEHIIAVDIDEQLMQRCEYEAKPKALDHLSCFSRKLTVDLFVGDIAEQDSRLLGVDAVICIELIEHLDNDTLKRVPATVFGFLRPKLAIFTTPNAEFNVVFNLTGFRHDDHKFEWIRSEFEEWCNSILISYQDYEVYYKGIGQGPEGTEILGCVSQMAVFVKKDLRDIEVAKQVTTKSYKLFSHLEYPFQVDTRSEAEKLNDEIRYQINKVILNKKLHEDYQSEDNVHEIPVSYLQNFVQDWCPSEESLIEQLLARNYNVKQSDNRYLITILDACDNSESDDSILISDNDGEGFLSNTGNFDDEPWD